MKILVCISNVPDTTTKINFTDNNTNFNTAGVQFIINPYDEIALTRALELTADGANGSVTVINVGEVNTEATIRKALAIGANDAIRINAKPSDAYFVAKQIAKVARENQYDVILTGRESIDYNGAQVAAMLGELLDMPSISICKKIEINGQEALIEKEIEGGKEIINTPLPFVASCSEGVAEPRIPNMRGIMSARTKPLQVLEASEATSFVKYLSYELPKPRGAVKLIPADQAEQLIDALHNEAKVI